MNARYENVRRQSDAAYAARAELRGALDKLSEAAKKCSKNLLPIEEVYGAVNRVKRAEEAHDIAVLDLATARGEDA